MFENLLSVADLSKRMTEALSNSMGNGYPILYNTIGIIAIFMQFMVYQMKNRKTILCWAMVNSVAWMAYFLLQGNFVSGVSCLLGILRNVVFIFRGKHAWADSYLWLGLFLCISGASSFGFVSWIDIFGLLAGLSSTIAFFMKEEKYIRSISLVTFIMYMINSVTHAYWVALVADTTAFISVIIAIVRYSKKRKQENPEEEKRVEEE